MIEKSFKTRPESNCRQWNQTQSNILSQLFWSQVFGMEETVRCRVVWMFLWQVRVQCWLIDQPLFGFTSVFCVVVKPRLSPGVSAGGGVVTPACRRPWIGLGPNIGSEAAARTHLQFHSFPTCTPCVTLLTLLGIYYYYFFFFFTSFLPLVKKQSDHWNLLFWDVFFLNK